MIDAPAAEPAAAEPAASEPGPASRIWCTSCRRNVRFTNMPVAELSVRFCATMQSDNLVCVECQTTVTTVYADCGKAD